MDALKSGGYRVLPLREALSQYDQGARDVRLAALTFDDGYRNILDYAAPLLSSYGWRATVFAISGFVGGTNQWPGQASSIPPSKLLTWKDLSELDRFGWEIGAHTVTHPDLTDLDDRRLTDEILGSRAMLEDRLGREVTSFAYPMGRYDLRSLAMVRRHFRAACTTRMGVANATTDRCQLERVETWYFGRYGLARLLGTPLAGPYIGLCRRIRNLRSQDRRYWDVHELAWNSESDLE